MTEALSAKPVDISALRERLGVPGKPLSPRELGAMLGGIHQTTVWRLENNPARQKGPLLILLQKLDAETPKLRKRQGRAA